MPLRLVTGPATEPVTLTEAKAHLRLEHNLDDAYVSALITAARQWAEQFCWRAFITQTFDLTLDAFPGGGFPIAFASMPEGTMGGRISPLTEAGRLSIVHGIELPFGSLQSVTSVQYVDDAGVFQTMPPGDYSVDDASEPGRLRLAYGKSWPSTRAQWDAVRIRYVVGWVDAASVPAPVKQALMLLVSQMYEHRTPEVLGVSVTPVQFAAESLLSIYRLALVG